MDDEIRFEAPGKGTWEMDALHCPKPLSGVLQEVFGDALSGGMRDACKRYGLLLDGLTVRFVNGFPYVQPKPVGAPEGASGTPPKLLFKLMTWLHPEIRRRLATARTLFERRPWLEELREWDETVKRRTLDAHARLHAVKLAELSDDALTVHMLEVVKHARRIATQDHSYNLSFAVPLGDFLLHAERWTGMEHAELLKIFRGDSDISAGDSSERVRLLAALRDDSQARALLDGDGEPHDQLEALSAHPGEVGEAMRAYLSIWGYALIHGLDITVPTVLEEPGPALAALRRLLASEPRKRNGTAKLEQSVRAKVPAEHLGQFDTQLEDARLTYRLRDERHLYGAMPALGLGRLTVLEIGRRLAKAGKLSAPELALHAQSPELAAMMTGTGPSSAELERRRDLRDSLDAADCPTVLGPPPSPPPPSDWLPSDGAQRLAEAAMTFFAASDQVHEQPSDSEVHGLAVSSGRYEGTARRCDDVGALHRIEQGDILVTTTTHSGINFVLPLLGAIVTDRGGALCHAAIVTREFGIPGVVGTRVGTERIRDGARIRVDGDAGVVTILSVSNPPRDE